MNATAIAITRVSLLILAATCILGGCANSTERRKGVADLELKSSKSPKDMAICISTKWENGSAGATYPIIMRPISNGGYTITIASYPDIFADVTEETGGGSQTRMFGDIWSTAFRDDVKKCVSDK